MLMKKDPGLLPGLAVQTRNGAKALWMKEAWPCLSGEILGNQSGRKQERSFINLHGLGISMYSCVCVGWGGGVGGGG